MEGLLIRVLRALWLFIFYYAIFLARVKHLYKHACRRKEVIIDVKFDKKENCIKVATEG